MTFEVSGRSARLRITGEMDRSTSIELQRGAGPPFQLWTLDERWHVSGAAAYRRAFAR